MHPGLCDATRKMLEQRNMRARPQLTRSSLGADAQLTCALRLALDTAGSRPAVFASDGAERAWMGVRLRACWRIVPGASQEPAGTSGKLSVRCGIQPSLVRFLDFHFLHRFGRFPGRIQRVKSFGPGGFE